ncbi:MAG: FxLYD domain-containing protein [Bryobacteraceae bacterium]
MATSGSTPNRIPRGLLIGAGATIALLAGILLYLSRPAPNSQAPPVSGEAKAYVAKLVLSDVTMQATENFMKQRVVEIEGKIANAGERELRGIDVYCLFYDVNGREIHRERVPVLNRKGAPLRPGESRDFRLPFDTLPEGWNQAMPRLVIAGIDFAS